MTIRTIAGDIKQMARNLVNATSVDSRVNIIRHFCTDPQVKKVLVGIFDKRIRSYLPTGCPPIKDIVQKYPQPIENRGLFRQMIAQAKVDYFFGIRESDKSTIAPFKLQQMFIEMMTNIHLEDRELFICLKDKVWPYYEIFALDAHLMKLALPEIEIDIIDIVKDDPIEEVKTKKTKVEKKKIENQPVEFPIEEIHNAIRSKMKYHTILREFKISPVNLKKIKDEM